jgi:hypothetical protein
MKLRGGGGGGWEEVGLEDALPIDRLVHGLGLLFPLLAGGELFAISSLPTMPSPKYALTRCFSKMSL